MQPANKYISAFSALLVLFLASSAFVLSFEALKDLAKHAGVAEQMAWLYPAIIDGAIIIFSLSVLRANLNRENVLYPWALVSLFTVLSVALNIIHAEQDFLARFLAAIPPVALFLSFELLTSHLKAVTIRLRAIQSLTEIDKEIQEKQIELSNVIVSRTAELDGIVHERKALLEKLDTEIKQLEDKISNLKEEARQKNEVVKNTLSTNIVKNGRSKHGRTIKKPDALQQLLTFLSNSPNASLSEMATIIGRSKSTAGAYVAELEAHNMLRKDSEGW